MTWLDWINTVLFWCGLCILSWNAYILIFNRCVPNIKTKGAIRERVTSLIKKDQQHKDSGRNAAFTIFDLGAGNGGMSRHIAKEMPDAHVKAYEISKLALFRCKLKQAFKPLSNLEYLNEDFLQADLSRADAVYMFLRPFATKALSEKLFKELKPGALVISNKFPLYEPWSNPDIMEIESLNPFQKTVYVYRKA